MIRKLKKILKVLISPLMIPRLLLLQQRNIINKLSLQDSIVELKDARFWVPNAPRDDVQNTILADSNFYEIKALERLSKYISDYSVVVDIGANIGNHSVYWSKVKQSKRVYAFEPVKVTYSILKRNIELNNLSETIKAYNVGLSAVKSKGTISAYNLDNIGMTQIETSEQGNIDIDTLDNIAEVLSEPKINLVKIDVEGHEKNVLLGAVMFFTKHKPAVYVESFPGKDNFRFVNEYFRKLGYKVPVRIYNDNYLFIY
jgi:FkbM family methyltransferase